VTRRLVEFGKTAGRVVLARLVTREPDAEQLKREAAAGRCLTPAELQRVLEADKH
jgi:hypothetical protein